jgi:hypothetical protein
VIGLLAVLHTLVAQTTIPGQKDAICKTQCEFLVVEGESVKFIDRRPPAKTLLLGKYAREAQRFVPDNEAPVADLRSTRGWHIVASEYLDHQEDEVDSRLRFFGPDGRMEASVKALMVLEDIKVALLNGTDELFAVTSNEEHAYNAQTAVWFLPENGKPKEVLEVPGELDSLNSGGAGHLAGVSVERQTYDGVHAETKGHVHEFYVWDAASKSLTIRSK